MSDNRDCNYGSNTGIENYKEIMWTANSCYFSVTMWFLWTIIPFREFICADKFDNKKEGFNAIKDLFDRFAVENEGSISIGELNFMNGDSTKNNPQAGTGGVYQSVVNSFFVDPGKISIPKDATELITLIINNTSNAFKQIFQVTETNVSMCINDENTTVFENQPRNELTVIQTPNSLDSLLIDETIKLDVSIINGENDNECKDTSYIKTTYNIPDSNKYLLVNFPNLIDSSEINQSYEKNNKMYKIKAAIAKSGDVNAGHYWCYVFDDQGENPFVLDDLNTYQKHIKSANNAGKVQLSDFPAFKAHSANSGKIITLLYKREDGVVVPDQEAEQKPSPFFQTIIEQLPENSTSQPNKGYIELLKIAFTRYNQNERLLAGDKLNLANFKPTTDKNGKQVNYSPITDEDKFKQFDTDINALYRAATAGDSEIGKRSGGGKKTRKARLPPQKKPVTSNRTRSRNRNGKKRIR